jgi:hypothetical protein
MGLDLGNMGQEREFATWTVAKQQQTDFFSFPVLALDMDGFHFLVFFMDFVFPPAPPSPQPRGKRILGRFFLTESACRLTVSIEVTVHDTRAPNTGGSPKHYF